MGRSAILSVRILGDAKGAVGAMRQTEKQTGLLSKGFGLVKKVGVGALAAVGAIAGTALVKGFSRLSAIENARAKLTGLGNDAGAVDKIMANALASVKGTSYGMDEAATTAAGAVAAGIKPGQELEGVLKSVANSAAASGSTMAEMGSIYNKVATANMAQNDVLNQVADRGIPIFQALAKEMGVTGGEVKKLASKGKIDFKTFEKAMTAASGTVADELGKTTTGSFKNMMASLSRLGAALLDGIFPAFSQVFGAAGGLIDGVTEKIGPAAQAIGERLGGALQGIVSWIGGGGLARAFAPFSGILAQVRQGITVMAAAFTSGKATIEGAGLPALFEGIGLVARQVFDQIGPAVSQVAEAFGPLIPKVVELASQFSPLSVLFQVFGGVLPQIVPLVAQVAATLGTVLQAVIPLASQLAGALVPLFIEFATSVLPPVVEAVTAVVGALQPLVTALLGMLIPAVQAVLPVVISIFQGILNNVVGAIQGITKVITGVVDFVGAIFRGDWAAAWSALGQIVSGAVQAVWNLIQLWIVGKMIGGIRSALGAAKGLFTGAWNAIKAVVTTGVQGVRQVIATVLAAVRNVINGNMNTARALFTRAWTSIKSVVTGAIRGVWSVITSTLGRITSAWRNAWNGAKNLLSAAWNGIRSAVSSGVGRVMSLVGSMPGRIKGLFSGAGRWLLNAGRNIVQGLLNGAGQLLPRIGQFFLNKLPGFIREPFKRALGIRSPSRVFAQYGQNISEGVTVGVAAKQAETVRSVTALGAAVAKAGQSKLANALDVNLGAPTLALTTAGQAAPASAPVTINVKVEAGVGDPVEIGREVDRVLTRYRRTMGAPTHA